MKTGAGTDRVADAQRYAYKPPEGSGGVQKDVAGIAIYGAMLGLLGSAFWLLRAHRATAP